MHWVRNRKVDGGAADLWPRRIEREEQSRSARRWPDEPAGEPVLRIRRVLGRQAVPAADVGDEVVAAVLDPGAPHRPTIHAQRATEEVEDGDANVDAGGVVQQRPVRLVDLA